MNHVMDTSDGAGGNDECYYRKIRNNHETAHKQALLGVTTQDGLSGVGYGISNCSVALSVIKLAKRVAI